MTGVAFTIVRNFFNAFLGRVDQLSNVFARTWDHPFGEEVRLFGAQGGIVPGMVSYMVVDGVHAINGVFGIIFLTVTFGIASQGFGRQSSCIPPF